MSDIQKVDFDLSAPSIQLVYETDVAKADVLPRLRAELAKAGCQLDFAEGTRQEVAFVKSGIWLVEIHPSYVDGKPIVDFINSKEFYDYCCRKKSKIHLVSDGFSSKRAENLYPLLSDLEAHFRVLVVKIGLDLKEYQARNRGKGVHLVSWLETSELFGSVLLNKASDAYFLEQVRKATTDEELKSARELTIADEFGYGEYKQFFAKLPDLRNKVMHGRVITQEEYKAAKEDLKELKLHIAAGDMARAFAQHMQVLSPVFQQLAETAQAAAKWVNQTLWAAQGVGAQLAAAQKASQSIGAALAASKPLNSAADAAIKAAASAAIPKIDFPIGPLQKEQKKLQ